MLNSLTPGREQSCTLDPMDRASIFYLVLPLGIFIVGWLQWWAALPLLACTVYALRPLAMPVGSYRPITRLQLLFAISVGCAWTICGGAGHLLFANPDWHVRDAVLHDLVVSPWPVGYGMIDGHESLLRAPLGFYLPAAVLGKWLGLHAAYAAIGLWTAIGSVLFLLQVFSLVPSRTGLIVMSAAVIVFFSGFDIVGSAINWGPRFFEYWDISQHIEWWAGSYQYSSMTTQLFWVPNHALGGWLIIGLIARDGRENHLNTLLPILVVAAALWSPLSAIGVVPFALWKVVTASARQRSLRLLHPRVWVPAMAVGIVIAMYLTLNAGGVQKGLLVGQGRDPTPVMDLLRQTQFFLLEAGITGFVILSIKRSSEVVLALAILALLPLAYLGPGNDLVMRASIPSIAVLAIAACKALSSECKDNIVARRKLVLVCMLVIGAVTAVQELARAVLVPPWPLNLQATLIGASCGTFAPHYVARIGNDMVAHLMRSPHRLPVGDVGPQACDNPALEIMWKRGLL